MAARKKPAAKKKAGKRGASRVDLYALHSAEYVARPEPAIVNVKRAYYLGIDGDGPPGSAAFTTAIGALYNVAFTVKMARKFAGTDYVVAKLEGLWWTSGHTTDFLGAPHEQWCWKLMIRIPDFIAAREITKAARSLVERGKSEDVTRVKRFALTEGRCVQALHVGAYSEEPATVERMRLVAESHGLRFSGVHHEIYLSDPRRVAPARLRTILRIPVKKTDG